jgi:hypothetical protein
MFVATVVGGEEGSDHKLPRDTKERVGAH